MMSVTVIVDGKKLSLNPFITTLTANLIQAVAKSLKASNGKRIEFVQQAEELTLDVDGQNVPLDLGNAKRIVGNIFQGLIKSLHGAENGKRFQFIYDE